MLDDFADADVYISGIKRRIGGPFPATSALPNQSPQDGSQIHPQSSSRTAITLHEWIANTAQNSMEDDS